MACLIFWPKNDIEIQPIAAVLLVSLLVGGFLVVIAAVRHQGNTTTVTGAMHWRLVNSPNTNASNHALLGIAVLSDRDAWAIGTTGATIFRPGSTNASISGPLAPLIEHWDGTQWRIVHSPHIETQAGLAGVAAVSADDIWAVGYSGNSVSRTLIEHWDGTQWSVVHSPSPGTVANALVGVKAFSADNIWAVGQTSDDKNHSTLIEHWNGRQWSVVASPSPGGFQVLYNIAGISTDDIWAVGIGQLGASPYPQTLIEHWNGRQWSIVRSPNPGTTFNSLQGIAVISANDVWATGTFNNSDNAVSTLIEHWDGIQWSVVSNPNPDRSQNLLAGITAISARDIWTVGYSFDGKTYHTLIEHWNGRQWSVVPGPGPKPGWTYQTLISIAHAPQSNRLWVVGIVGKFQPPVSQTLVVTLP
ncbi:MAG: hypothetical protein H0W02_24585 [Ktedonobacteraceae bacterium]|nr:hypothetical protein [Ktedonobacteraceae bacterium]